MLVGLPETVTFTTHDNALLPDPHFLALHATCAKVTHIPGAGEYIYGVDRDMDTTPVLSKDGSSSRVLIEAMTRIAIAI